MWTVSQRRALIAIFGTAVGTLGVVAYFRPVHLGAVLPDQGSRAAELTDRLDPNTADATTLSTLPRLGEKRARDIVAYRERFTTDHPGRLAFEGPADLMNIKGIGPATVKNLTPYLSFDSPATSPSPGD